MNHCAPRMSWPGPRRRLHIGAIALLALAAGWWLARKAVGPLESASGGSPAAPEAQGSPPVGPVALGEANGPNKAGLPGVKSSPSLSPSPSPSPSSAPVRTTLPRFVQAGSELANRVGPDSGADPAAGKLRFTADASGIAAALQEAVPDIKKCYEAWLQVNPKLAGTVTVSFTLSPSTDAPAEGRITKTGVADSSLGHLAMEGCLLSVVDDLRFDAPPGELQVRFPITMSSHDVPKED